MNKQTSSSVTKGPGARAWTFCISKEEPDRDGDIVSLDGLDLTHYRRNPCVLLSHQYRQGLPIATTSKLWRESDSLYATAQFPPQGIHETADTAYLLVEEGILRGASIGFRVNKSHRREDGIRIIDDSELYEWSIVNVGSNRSALSIAAAKGLDMELVTKALGDPLENQVRGILYQVLRPLVRDAMRRNMTAVTGKLYD